MDTAMPSAKKMEKKSSLGCAVSATYDTAPLPSGDIICVSIDVTTAARRLSKTAGMPILSISDFSLLRTLILFVSI